MLEGAVKGAVVNVNWRSLCLDLNDLCLQAHLVIGNDDVPEEEARMLVSYVVQIRRLLADLEEAEQGLEGYGRIVPLIIDLKEQYCRLEGKAKEVRNTVRKAKL